MFSGIVTAKRTCRKIEQGDGVLRLTFKNPYKRLKEGGSVSVNGVCLTAEKLYKSSMRFALGAETLRITKWRADCLKGQIFNLEEAVSFHSLLGGGGLFSGHADGTAQITQIKHAGECRELSVKTAFKISHIFFEKKPPLP